MLLFSVCFAFFERFLKKALDFRFGPFWGLLGGSRGALGPLRRVAAGAQVGPPYRRELLFLGLFGASWAAALPLLVVFSPVWCPLLSIR